MVTGIRAKHYMMKNKLKKTIRCKDCNKILIQPNKSKLCSRCSDILRTRIDNLKIKLKGDYDRMGIEANKMRRKILKEIDKWWSDDCESNIEPLLRAIKKIKEGDL